MGLRVTFQDIPTKLSSELDLSLFMLNGSMTPMRIKKLRQKYGMTQVVFADILGVSYETYNSWERGVRKPSSPSCALLQIAEKHHAIFLENRRDIIEGVMKYFSKKV